MLLYRECLWMSGRINGKCKAYKNWKNHYDSIKRRERDLEKLKGWIEVKLLADKDVIIVGDFNERIDSAPFAKLNENDTFYFCTSELSYEYSYTGIKSLIDHIIVSKVSGGAKGEYVEKSTRVFPTKSC
jgi:predicted extracellular nuclease